jgi:hypothetical protein
MRRALAGPLLGVVLLAAPLAACGSNNSSSNSSSSVATTSAAATTSTAASSADQASTGSSDMSSPDMGSGASEPMTSGGSASTTVGGDTTSLDAQTAAFFTTTCEGLTDLTQMGSSMAGQTGADTKSIGAAVKKAGDSMTETANKLKALPPPTFDGGADFAAKMEAGLAELGGKLSSAADKVAAGDTSALSSLASDMQSGPLADLQNISPTPGLQAAVQNLPACKALSAG